MPIELQRNFTLMRDLDTRAQGLMKDIDKLADDYLKNVKKESNDKKKEQLTHIQSLFNKAKEYGDDKVRIIALIRLCQMTNKKKHYFAGTTGNSDL